MPAGIDATIVGVVSGDGSASGRDATTGAMRITSSRVLAYVAAATSNPTTMAEYAHDEWDHSHAEDVAPSL